MAAIDLDDGGGIHDAAAMHDAPSDAPTFDGNPASPDASIDARIPDASNPAMSSGLCMPNGFCWEYPSLFGITLEAVWGSSPTDVWAVGYGGAIVHFDGTSWSIEPSPTRSTLYAISGTDASNVWAVGEAGVVLHWEGTRWVSIDGGTTRDLRAVQALQSGHVWVVGAEEVRRFDGTRWSVLTPIETPISNIQLLARSDSDVWLASTQHVQHWNGSAWQWIPVDASSSISVITSMAAANERIYLFLRGEHHPVFSLSEEGRFEPVALPEEMRRMILNDGVVGASGLSDVWAIGYRGAIHFDGHDWNIALDEPLKVSRGSWFAEDCGFVVGVDGMILERRGPTLSSVSTHASVGAERGLLFNVDFGRDDEHEWVAARGALLHRAPSAREWVRVPIENHEITPFAFFDGEIWFGTPEPTVAAIVVYGGSDMLRPAATDPVARQWMNFVWANPDRSELLFGGAGGIVKRSSVGEFSMASDCWIDAIDGSSSEVWAVGQNGCVRQRVGADRFTALDPGVSSDLTAVHYVSSAEVWIGGVDSTLLKWDGSFHRITLPTVRFGNRNFQIVVSIAGAIDGPHGLWVLLGGGEIVEMRSGREPILHSLHFEGTRAEFATPDELVVVGQGQSIVRRRF